MQYATCSVYEVRIYVHIYLHTFAYMYVCNMFNACTYMCYVLCTGLMITTGRWTKSGDRSSLTNVQTKSPISCQSLMCFFLMSQHSSLVIISRAIATSFQVVQFGGACKKCGYNNDIHDQPFRAHPQSRVDTLQHYKNTF